ncbi:hypothetical protein GXW74_15025 [Roseomonas eburnea]|uniref:Uncharacterized protein n=1 Tax=Neoroseomonas eburnea TaxID=1346889 RepID=A0A9X9XDM0_9PROT|nr:hypothetical protein [Neoroseomonas eburnea]MBR0681806.1 hypothetical protein [Neoroseomonas eburnea]
MPEVKRSYVERREGQMRGIGGLGDGFAFTEAEIERGTARFWWSARRKAAYRAALDRQGRRESAGQQDGGWDGGWRPDDNTLTRGAAAGAIATLPEAFEDKRHADGGGSPAGDVDTGSSSGGTSSDSGGGSSE